MGDGLIEELSDSALVDAARGGDQQAFAELYERYFDAVYDFVLRMTRNREEAADLAQDTFIKAMNALGGLQQGASFKSWIFTIARNSTLNRLERASRTRPLAYEDDEGEEVGFDVVDTGRFNDPEEAAQANAMASLVWEAAKGLDPQQLTLLDLHLRQGLESAEIAEVMGVTKNNGYVMLNRLKKAVEESIGAFLMLHDGRKYCDALDAALDEAGIVSLDPPTRKLIDKHVAQCDTCEERRKKLVSPLSIFGAFAPVGAPLGLKENIAAEIVRQWPGPPDTGTGMDSTGGGEPPEPPVAIGGEGGPSWSRRVAQATVGAASLAAVLGVLLFLPVSPFALNGGDDGNATLPAHIDAGDDEPEGPPATLTPTPVTVPGGQATETPTTEPVPTDTPEPGETPSPAPSPTTAGVIASTATPSATSTATPVTATPPTATSTATNTPTNTPTPTSTPTPTTVPCTPVLTTNPLPGGLNLGTGSQGTFQLLNTAPCPATVTLSVPSGSSWLSVADPQSPFTLGGASQRTIVIRIDRSQLPSGNNTGQVRAVASPGGSAVTVQVHATGPTPTPTPTATPTATPTPVVDTQAPSITGASACLGPGAAAVHFTVQARDNVGVIRVLVSENSPGTNSIALSRTGGTAQQGTWTGQMPYQTFEASWTVRADDAEGNSGTTVIQQQPPPPC